VEENIVSVALGFNIALNSRFTSLTGNRVDVIPIGPELSTPEFRPKVGKTSEYLSGGKAFDHSGQLRRRVHRHGLDEEVDMVLVCSNLDEVDLVSPGNFRTHLFELLIYLRVKPLLSPLTNTYQVVQQNRNTVTLVKIDTHPTQV